MGKAVDYFGIIETESNWITSLQQPSGALLMSRDYTEEWEGSPHYKIEPYFANFAVIGLLENPSSTNIIAVKKWINWYLSHMNSPDYNGLNGTIYVYYADTASGIEHPSDHYDSTDSYGATFITLLRKYYGVSHDSLLLIEHRIKIEQIADSVIATQDLDGLTYAKPDWDAKYTMDNAEVNEGLKDLIFLEKHVFKDLNKAEYYQKKLDENTEGIEKFLWNPLTNCYDQCRGKTSRWEVLYPDAMCQWFPIWNGVIHPDSARAKNLYSQFNRHYHGWSSLTIPDSGFTNAWMVLTAALMRDNERVNVFLEKVRSKFMDAGHRWGWFNAEAGHAIRAARLAGDEQSLALGKLVALSGNCMNASCKNDGDANNPQRE